MAERGIDTGAPRDSGGPPSRIANDPAGWYKIDTGLNDQQDNNPLSDCLGATVRRKLTEISAFHVECEKIPGIPEVLAWLQSINDDINHWL